ncbi:zinc finger BED domain-containing protein DAYSLEEPER-like [Juglans microcarpa x Juglans regia]|uniref:zinc finger BED domain-containing protein DAYSLEEPER-like n=1 Tax=Juglans microcarpa x Juglans regia TaxID=2249226 RepID=UPI001B7E1FDC|nr:zinc finger BED domain-containing protein DAYSLEEPER-like [Juglans microcarpa x Juglans regia]
MEIDYPITPTENYEPLCLEAPPNKRRRKKSIVWEHFTIETVGPGCTRACCKLCKKSFAYITGSKLAGTSHLKRHIALGICPVFRQKNQQSPYTPGSRTGGTGSGTDPPKKRHRATHGLASISFDQDRCSNEIAKMIILHDYPLHIVEHAGFNDFIRTLQPQFNNLSFNTVQEDCVAVYLKEKQSLRNLISGIPGYVSLTLDLWTSNQTLGYVFLTGYFIDGDWNLQRRILNVVMVPSPESDYAFNQAVVACLSDWHLKGRLFALAVDQSFSNETSMGNLRGLLSVRNPLMLNGQLLIGNCYARVLSRLAQDALGAMRETIQKLRESVKYVNTSESHKEKFIELKQQLQVPSSKDLSIDDQTKWNTTYHMLVAACELKEVFNCLDTADPDYKISPSMDEWKQIETLCTYLKHLFDAANILTSPSYPATNTFFLEVSKLQIELTHAATSQDPFVSNLIKPLQEKFDKYWKDCYLVLAIAVVLDPRFKMKLVEFTLSKIYGENADSWIRAVKDSVHELFLEHIAQAHPLPAIEEGNEGITKTETQQEGSQEGSHVSTVDGLSDFETYINEITSSQHMKSELDQYLEESLLPRAREFDILDWWKLNKLKYPTLSKMASDVLSIPVCTVSPDCVFDTEVRKMDNYRSSLHPVTLEALVCTKDWFQSGSSSSQSSIQVSNAIVKMEF